MPVINPLIPPAQNAAQLVPRYTGMPVDGLPASVANRLPLGLALPWSAPHAGSRTLLVSKAMVGELERRKLGGQRIKNRKRVPGPSYEEVMRRPVRFNVTELSRLTFERSSAFNLPADLNELCVSVDTASVSIHAPDGCSRGALRQAMHAGLIQSKHLRKFDCAALLAVPEGSGNYRCEFAYPAHPHNKQVVSEAHYHVGARFLSLGGDTIFLQVKECGGNLKREFGNGCSKPAASLTVSQSGMVSIAINRVRRKGGKVVEKKFVKNIVDMSNRIGAENLDRWRLIMHRSPDNPWIEVYLNRRRLLRHEGSFGAPDSLTSLVKTGIYMPKANPAKRCYTPAIGKTTVLIDDLSEVHLEPG